MKTEPAGNKTFEEVVKAIRSAGKKINSLHYHPCGCNLTMPHSHLVNGYSCPCETGIPENKL